MKMRQLKLNTMARMEPPGGWSPNPIIQFKKTEVVKLYKVARVKDSVVVLETESHDEAREAIDKAARQKKAKLFLLDGEPFEYEGTTA
jgi:hypothetical protein